MALIRAKLVISLALLDHAQHLVHTLTGHTVEPCAREAVGGSEARRARHSLASPQAALPRPSLAIVIPSR